MPKVSIIAELCQNHNGNIINVEQMVHEAAENGATHVKIQNIYANMLTKRAQFELGIKINGSVAAITRPYQAEYDRLKGLELSFSDCEKFIDTCRKVGVIPVTTCFSHGTLREIQEIGFEEIKVASYDCGSLPLIERLSKAFKHIYISTGSTFDNEIVNSVKLLKKSKVDFTLFHCVTIYPTPLNEMNLSRMNYIKKLGEINNIGLSEHSLYERDGVLASMAAIALGANCIERHFTNVGPSETKDGPVSIDSKGLKKLSFFSKLSKSEQIDELNYIMPDWEKIMLGKPDRLLSSVELLNREYYRGRFGTPRQRYTSENMIYNWEMFDE